MLLLERRQPFKLFAKKLKTTGEQTGKRVGQNNHDFIACFFTTKSVSWAFVYRRKTNWSLIAVLTLMFLKDSNKGVNFRYLKTRML